MKKAILAIQLDHCSQPFICSLLDSEANSLVARWASGQLPSPVFGSMHVKTQQDPTTWAVRTDNIVGMTVVDPAAAAQQMQQRQGYYGGSGLN